MRAGRLGAIATFGGGQGGRLVALAPRWAADNGCYSGGAGFDLGRYLAWLDGLPRASCLFAVAPDVVGDAAATWERSRAALPRLRAAGYPAALVAQDGIERGPVDWASFDALFVGGTTAWKLSEPVYALVAEARRRGKWCHMGRVNSWRRLRAAALAGYDSADGTQCSFRPDETTALVLRWLGELERQPALFVG